MNLSDYVKVYDNAMPTSMCQDLIRQFNSEPHNHVRRDTDVMSFSEINIVESGWDMSKFFPLMHMYKAQYYRDCGITDAMINPDHTWEQLRMKKYVAGTNDSFRPHNDVWNLQNARRFLVFFWYLNDVHEGGETEFYNLDKEIKVKPKQGRLIMFPPIWTYLHAGLNPISNDKYIVGGYLHYK